MTTVRRSDWLGCSFGFAGCGTSALSPLGVTGAMTMKMINSTSSTSMNGVTFMSHFKLPVPPTAIDIRLSSLKTPSPSELVLLLLDLIGHQPELIDPGCSQIVHHFDHLGVLGPRIGLHIAGLVLATGDQVLDLGRQIRGFGAILAEEGLAVARDRDHDCVFLLRVGHGDRILRLVEVHADALGQR